MNFKLKAYHLVMPCITLALISVTVFAYNDLAVLKKNNSDAKTLIEGFVQLSIALGLILGYKALQKRKQLQ